MILSIVTPRSLWGVLLGALLLLGTAGHTEAASVMVDLYAGRTPINNAHISLATEQCTVVCYVDAANGDDANSGATPAAAKRTIQAAIDVVQPSGEVRVLTGAYTEQIVIEKSLRLIGEKGADVTFIHAPASLPGAANPDSTIVKIAGAGIDVEVAGFTVTGPGPTGCRSIGAGIFVRDGANATIRDNVIRAIRDEPLSDCQNGVGVQVGRAALAITGTATIRSNTFVGYQKNGVTVSGVGSSALIDRNSITGAGPNAVIAQNGVQVSDSATATLTGNTIRNHAFTPPGTVAAGLLILGADADTVGNTFSENQISIYHIDGDGVHDGNRVRTTGAGVGSYAFWGIVADDPPPGRLPSPFDAPAAFARAEAGAAAVSGASATTKTIRVINNELESDNSTGGFAIEADGGYGSMDIDFTAMNNHIRNWDYGVVIFQCVGQPHCTSAGFITATVQLNSIVGSFVGLHSATDNFISNSTLNWWGASTGPNTPGAGVIVGDAGFTPWLCNDTDTSAAIGFQPDMTAICDGRGDVTVNTIVDWNGAPAVDGQRFDVCITGASSPEGDCQTTSGGLLTWSNLLVGNYRLTVRDPGPSWAVTLPDTVTIADTEPAQATVTNTLRSGMLIVDTLLDWQGMPPGNAVSFEICVSGPSYSTPLCQITSGGALSFGPLAPGAYAVNATPVDNWRTTISNPTPTVGPAQTVSVTVASRYVGPTLECPLLDDFNRADTPNGLGNNWAGATDTYRINANQLQPFSTGSAIVWNDPPFIFDADQVACVQLATIAPDDGHYSLILKAQTTNDYANGMILAVYNVLDQLVLIETVEPGVPGWTTRLEISAAFVDGDVFGARAMANGLVGVYRNNELIAAAPTSNFFTNLGGRIGVWLSEAEASRFDNFGGGNTPSSMASGVDDGGRSINLYLPAIQR